VKNILETMKKPNKLCLILQEKNILKSLKSNDFNKFQAKKL